ncbi:MAG: hypothetical protein Q8Q12_00605 [bacterium]|nr:hypothetical protein [bacterium]
MTLWTILGPGAGLVAGFLLGVFIERRQWRAWAAWRADEVQREAAARIAHLPRMHTDFLN